MQTAPMSVALDAMLTLDEFAAWMRMNPRTVRDKVRAGEISVFALNRRLWRFHPRTVLAYLARRSGLQIELPPSEVRVEEVNILAPV